MHSRLAELTPAWTVETAEGPDPFRDAPVVSTVPGPLSRVDSPLPLPAQVPTWKVEETDVEVTDVEVTDAEVTDVEQGDFINPAPAAPPAAAPKRGDFVNPMLAAAPARRSSQIPPSTVTTGPIFMQEFFFSVDLIKEDIASIHSATFSIADINAEAQLATNNKQEKAISKRLKPLVAETNKCARRCKTALEAMKVSRALSRALSWALSTAGSSSFFSPMPSSQVGAEGFGSSYPTVLTTSFVDLQGGGFGPGISTDSTSSTSPSVAMQRILLVLCLLFTCASSRCKQPYAPSRCRRSPCSAFRLFARSHCKQPYAPQAENSRLQDAKRTKVAELRIRINLNLTLTRKFIDEMKNYQAAQAKFKDDIKTKVTRQVQIVRPSATPLEIETVMSSEGGAQKVYEDQILKGSIASPILSSYQQVSQKYADVLLLEKSVAEVNQMFLDFALLTEQQGEMLDQIEFNVRNAYEFIEEGNLEFTSAIDYQRRIRKKQCCIIVLVLVVLIIVLASSGVFS